MEMRDTLTHRMEVELGAWFYDCVKHDFILNPRRDISPKMEGMLAELHPPEKKES